MAKKICVIKTSLRLNSNSDQLADAFIQGAKESGNSVEEISLKDKNIAFCKGCLACLKLGECVIKDDANSITEHIKTSRCYCIGQRRFIIMKCQDKWKSWLIELILFIHLIINLRDVYLLSTAAENEEGVDKRAINGLKGWVNCYPKAHFVGSVFAGGVDIPK